MDRWRAALWFAVLLSGGSTGFAFGQAPPAPIAAVNEAPSIRIGATLFADYTYTADPEATDAEGNAIHLSAFNVTRSYVNVTGSISPLIAFRLTPDIARETGSDSSLSGSLVFRVKYAYAQVNLDQWLPSGAWARFGIQQTPWFDFIESVYRYRFQGTVFVEREGYFASADAGASFHYAAPADYGDVHVGVYNGENYNRAETNDQKALQVRGTLRPFARATGPWRGIRVTGFLDADHYIRRGERTRAIGSVTLEHPVLNAGAEYLRAVDQPSTLRSQTESRGYSLWVTPKTTAGWEGLLRYDHLEPNIAAPQRRTRTIAGIAYWFPHQGNVASAVLVDVDRQRVRNGSTPQLTQRLAVHALVNF